MRERAHSNGSRSAKRRGAWALPLAIGLSCGAVVGLFLNAQSKGVGPVGQLVGVEDARSVAPEFSAQIELDASGSQSDTGELAPAVGEIPALDTVYPVVKPPSGRFLPPAKSIPRSSPPLGEASAAPAKVALGPLARRDGPVQPEPNLPSGDAGPAVQFGTGARQEERLRLSTAVPAVGRNSRLTVKRDAPNPTTPPSVAEAAPTAPLDQEPVSQADKGELAEPSGAVQPKAHASSRIAAVLVRAPVTMAPAPVPPVWVSQIASLRPVTLPQLGAPTLLDVPFADAITVPAPRIVSLVLAAWSAPDQGAAADLIGLAAAMADEEEGARPEAVLLETTGAQREALGAVAEALPEDEGASLIRLASRGSSAAAPLRVVPALAGVTDITTVPEAIAPASRAPTPAAPGRAAGVTLDTILYGRDRRIRLAGRAPYSQPIRVLLDGERVLETISTDGGTWTATVTGIAQGRYVLVVEALGAGGVVESSASSPFQRVFPSVAQAADPSLIIVQPGQNLWGIADTRYGSGYEFVQIYAANREEIDDPDLIFPGQILTLPEETAFLPLPIALP